MKTSMNTTKNMNKNIICNNNINNITNITVMNNQKHNTTSNNKKSNNNIMINVISPNTKHGTVLNSKETSLSLHHHEVTGDVTTAIPSATSMLTTITTTTTNNTNNKDNTLTTYSLTQARTIQPTKSNPSQNSFPVRRSFKVRERWCWWGRVMVVMVATVVTPPAVSGSMLDMICSSVCRHGSCSYPVTTGNKPMVRCHCHPGWGGDHCTLPCSLPCANDGRCVFVGDRQMCLCPLVGLSRTNCSGYDVSALLGLAELLREGPWGFEPESRSRAVPPPASNERGSSTPPPPPSVLSSLPRGGDHTASVQQASTPVSKDKVRPQTTTTTTTTPPPPPPLPKGKVESPSQSSAAARPHLQGDVLHIIAPPGLDLHVTSRPEVRNAGKTKRALLVTLVTNPHDLVQQNVRKGASQCTSNFVCHNGGRCVGGRFGGFRCQCKPPYFGTFCEHSCPRQCLNGARCLRVPERQRGRRVADPWIPPTFVYRCVCPAGFSGPRCENHAVS